LSESFSDSLLESKLASRREITPAPITGSSCRPV